MVGIADVAFIYRDEVVVLMPRAFHFLKVPYLHLICHCCCCCRGHVLIRARIVDYLHSVQRVLIFPLSSESLLQIISAYKTSLAQEC